MEQLLILVRLEIEQFQSSFTVAYEVIITICTRVWEIMTYLVSRYEAIKLRPLDYNIRTISAQSFFGSVKKM